MIEPTLPTPKRSRGVIECLGIGPGRMKQQDVKTMIGEMMTVSALLSGFAIGMSSKVTDSAIRAYAEFLKAEFFGKHSHFCEFERSTALPQDYGVAGLPPIHNSFGVPFGDTCSADGCWVGHWGTNEAAKELGYGDACSLTVEQVKATYPKYWEDYVESKVVAVQQELGYNTMFIIFTTVTVVFTGSLLRLSIVKKTDTPKAWMVRFYPIVVVLACLPLLNFYNFLMLASRVIRVIFKCARAPEIEPHSSRCRAHRALHARAQPRSLRAQTATTSSRTRAWSRTRRRGSGCSTC